MAEVRTVIGLMSGTSMDGVDVAMLRTDGIKIAEFGPFETYDYTDQDRAVVARAVAAARSITQRDDRPGPLAVAEQLITDRHVEAIGSFLNKVGLPSSDVDLLGFHGQTVFHDPGLALTVQIGDGQGLADRTGIDVVWDMRADDVSAGGQGAPLAPVFHRALADLADLPRPVVFLNIGGVANVTWIGADGELLAFDTGPGNALIDDWMQSVAGERFDRDGENARRGKEPGSALIQAFLDDDYFSLNPPKSLDRDHFSVPALGSCSLEDGARLLTRLTVESIAAALQVFPGRPVTWIASGGGARNSFMLELLQDRLDGVLVPAEDCGFDGDAIEAQAFGFLAVRSARGLPLSFPGTTGVSRPLTGGRRSHSGP